MSHERIAFHMQVPIVAFEIDSSDIMIFETLDHAWRYIEYPDLEEYELYDSSGLSIQLTLQGAETFFHVPKVVLTPTLIDESESLRVRLVKYVKNWKLLDETDACDLKALIEVVLKRQGYS